MPCKPHKASYTETKIPDQVIRISTLHDSHVIIIESPVELQSCGSKGRVSSIVSIAFLVFENSLEGASVSEIK